MNALTQQLFNALSFANVSNLGEFRTLLNQIDAPDHSAKQPEQPKANSQTSDSAPILGHIQGAV